MESNETSHLVVRSVRGQGDPSPTFNFAQCTEQVNDENIRFKAKQLLTRNETQFRSGLMQELGSIRDIQELDISQPSNVQKIKFLDCVNEEIVKIHKKQELNERLIALVAPCKNNDSHKYEGTFCANVVFNFLGVCGAGTGAIIASSKISQKPWWNCFFSAEDPCIQNPTTFNCSQTFPCCDNYASTFCKPIQDSLFFQRLSRQAIIFSSIISGLCVLQVLIQLFRIKYIKPSKQVDSDTIALVSEYKSAAEHLDFQTENLKISPRK